MYGVDVGGKKMRYLRRIPTDPMTNSTEWGLRSMQDDPRQTHGADRTYSTCLPRPKGQAWTVPSTKSGDHGLA